MAPQHTQPSQESDSPRIWFITGSSSGIGLAVTEHVLAQGDIVVATLRTPSAISHLEAQYPKSQLLVVKLDVTKLEEIAAAFKTAVDTFGRIDIVFNNAGFAPFGEVESVPLEIARDVFEVNFWGATNVAREAVRTFRDGEKPGYIINTSSLVALKPSVLGAYYSSTKFALNGLIEGLAQELGPAWNIRITLVELGAFETRGINDGYATLSSKIPPHPAYAANASLPSSVRRALIASKPAGSKSAGEPRKAAREIFRLSRLAFNGSVIGDVPLHFPLGLDSVELLKSRARVYAEAAEKWNDWSADLTWDE